MRIIAAIRSATPTMAPTTIPAIAPPERPEPDLFAPAPAAADVADGTADVLEGKRGGIDVVVGSSTFSHRDSTFELTQQESVALGELEAQNEQSPAKLD